MGGGAGGSPAYISPTHEHLEWMSWFSSAGQRRYRTGATRNGSPSGASGEYRVMPTMS